MNYFIFDYKQHSHLIGSFLKSAALAHSHSVHKNVEWFNWKFRENPFGEAILACAEENEKIIGCVAYGMQPFWLNDKKLNGVLSFETFVHPEFQGRGVFVNLLRIAEKEVINREVDLMLNFPNSNSLIGFLKYGWKQIDKPEYWIKGKSFLTIPLSFIDLRKGFQTENSNLNDLEAQTSFIQIPVKKLTSLITLDYLKWRFFSHPVSEYVVINNDDLYSIIRMGKRGEIREAQVLILNKKEGNKIKMSKFIKACKSKTNYDIISFSISKNNPIRHHLKKSLFVKVPNQTNICYKILNKEVVKDEDVQKISINAINYHTY